MAQRQAGTGRVTIMQVAKAAGVSHQTVSRYLRADPGMREEIRERIRAAVEELGYRPNLLARSMRTRRSGRLGIVLPPGQTPSVITLLDGATAAANEAGYAVEVVIVDGALEQRAERLAELAGSGQVEGLLLLTDLPLPQPVSEDSAVIVLDPDYDHRRRSVGHLGDVSVLSGMIEHLAELGHRRLMHAAGPVGHPSADARRDAYLATVRRLRLSSWGVVHGDWTGEAGHRAVSRLPEDRSVTAVVAASDVVAAGVIRGAWERGWSVPGDLSVTGWDDEPVGRFLSPSLSTVVTDHARHGREAMGELIGAVRGEPVEAAGHAPLSHAVWRESVGPAAISPSPPSRGPRRRSSAGPRGK